MWPKKGFLNARKFYRLNYQLKHALKMKEMVFFFFFFFTFKDCCDESGDLCREEFPFSTTRQVSATAFTVWLHGEERHGNGGEEDERSRATAQRGHYENQAVKNRKRMDQNNEAIQKEMKHQALSCPAV